MLHFTYKFAFIIFSISLFANCAGIKGSYNKNLLSVSEQKPIIISNVSIFNGKENGLIENQDVFLRNGKIESIATFNTLEYKGDETIITGKGKVLMPGLIDAHVHITSNGSPPWNIVKPNPEFNLNAYLYAGITTVYDLGGIASKTDHLRKKVNKGKTLGPTIFNTHAPITVAGGHPIPIGKMGAPFPINKLIDFVVPTIKDSADAEKLMKKYTRNKIDYIKIVCDQLPSGIPEMQSKQLTALITEAHKLGFKVFVHVGSSDNAITAIKAGADVLAHGIYRSELSDDDAKFIAKSSVPIIYTLGAFESTYLLSKKSYKISKWDATLLPQEILTPLSTDQSEEINKLDLMVRFVEDLDKNRPYWRKNLGKLRKFGAKIAIGTDSSLPGSYPGSSLYNELRLLSNYGMSNFELLNGATNLNSHLFLDDPHFGSVEVGKQADLLLLNDNPITNLSSVETPNTIIIKGKIIKREIGQLSN